jgi:hypothetical protein
VFHKDFYLPAHYYIRLRRLSYVIPYSGNPVDLLGSCFFLKDSANYFKTFYYSTLILFLTKNDMIGAVDKNLRKFAVIFYLEDNKSCFGAIHAFFGLKVK